jgi:hypothetical protein
MENTFAKTIEKVFAKGQRQNLGKPINMGSPRFFKLAVGTIWVYFHY